MEKTWFSLLVLIFAFPVSPSLEPSSGVSRSAPENDNLFHSLYSASAEENKTSIAEFKPGAGKFLVATTELLHSAFDKTVILLLEYSTQGAVGLVINKPSHIPLNQVFSKTPGQTKWTENLYWGGPVSSESLNLLLKTDQQSKGMRMMVDNLYWVHDSMMVKKILESGWPDSEARVYAGFSGWGAGQLEDEILKGSWKIIQADVRSIFFPPSEQIWKELFFLSNSKWGEVRSPLKTKSCSNHHLEEGMPEDCI
ncbi:MAG TPA: YqgE/AlgH family protein [SAR324 cluster bacterium]|jgi:putative transcriptional regulator|nr:YqgE/AlgH family protein [SAR324 cluster bacterium]|tara:strand:- start:4961 stop:5719 length:759 start_codon:yes stop_codon:yes gene_type:complete